MHAIVAELPRSLLKIVKLQHHWTLLLLLLLVWIGIEVQVRRRMLGALSIELLRARRLIEAVELQCERQLARFLKDVFNFFKLWIGDGIQVRKAVESFVGQLIRLRAERRGQIRWQVMFL